MPTKKPEDKAEKPVKVSAQAAKAEKPSPAKTVAASKASPKTAKAPAKTEGSLVAKAIKAEKPASAKTVAAPKASPKTVKAPAKKTAPKKHSPEKAFVQNPSPEVVILPQSQNKVFLIWRAQPELDESTDSWVIRTSFGEKARVPAASRSAFLTGNGVFTVDIYRMLKDGSELLFLSKTTKEEEYYSTASPGQMEEVLPRLNSSSQNFRRRISS